jgi:hypothetical protein
MSCGLRSEGTGDHNNSTSQIMYSPRIISFFDILGFRNFVLNHKLQDVIKCFQIVFNSICSASARLTTRMILDPLAFKDREQFLVKLKEKSANGDGRSSPRSVLEYFENETGWEALLLSDSLLLYSEEISEKPPLKALTNAILISRIITMKFFEQYLPVRGAISFGEFYANREDSIYFGKALVEAYELTESQQWIGTAIAPSAEEYASVLAKDFQISTLSDLCSVRPGWDLIRWEIPLKTGFKEGWVVNWASAWNAGGPVPDDFFDSRLTGDPQVDQKYANTLRFLQEWREK